METKHRGVLHFMTGGSVRITYYEYGLPKTETIGSNLREAYDKFFVAGESHGLYPSNTYFVFDWHATSDTTIRCSNNMICPRCHNPMPIYTMSRFNTEYICVWNCVERERAHPKYAEAAAAELAAVRAGELNYPGIGCPPELYLPVPVSTGNSN